MRRLRLIFASSLMVAAGVACGAFSGSSADPSVDAGDDASSDGREDAGDGMADDGTRADGPVQNGPCTPPAGPTCALQGCQRRTLYTPDVPSYPFQIATDSTYAYWIDQPKTDAGDAYNGNAMARVLRVPLAGPTSATVTLASGQPSGTTLTVAGPHVYWATWDGASSTSTLHRVPAACAPPGCSVEDVGSAQPRFAKLVAAGSSAVVAIAGDGKVVRFEIGGAGKVKPAQVVMTSGKFPGLALTKTHIYASSLLENTISRATIDGLTSQPGWATFSFDGGSVGVSNLATDCTNLYGVRNPGATIETISLANGAVTGTASLGTKTVYDVAADASYFYIGSLNGGGIYALDTKVGGFTPIDATASAFFIAVDAAGLYWGDHASPGNNGGTITMMVKK